MNNTAWSKIWSYSIGIHLLVVLVISLFLGNIVMKHEHEEMYVVDLQADFLQGSGHEGGNNADELFSEKLDTAVMENRLKDITLAQHVVADNVPVSTERTVTEDSSSAHKSSTKGNSKASGASEGKGNGKGQGIGDGQGHGKGQGLDKGSGEGQTKGAGHIPFDLNGFVNAVEAAKVYPNQAVMRGLTGVVTVAVSLDANGNCINAAVASSSGHSILDKAALKAVYGATPYPNAEKKTVNVNVPVRFNLN